MMLVSLSSLILLSVLSVQCFFIPPWYCDESGKLLYEEIGCTPIKGFRNCVTSYNCSNYRLPKQGCLFEKHVYKDGEAINDTNPCHNCTCVGNAKNGSKIECHNVKYTGPFFPLIFGYGGPPSDCYLSYELNKCYPSKLKCPPYKDMSICVVDSKVYIEGEKFQPYGKCLDCVCQKGYNGTFVEPFCRKNRCDVEVRYSKQIVDNCAPLYNNNYPLCCPYDFICPSNSKIEHLVKQNSTHHVEKCKFGTQTFNKFDRMDLVYGNNITANCVCSLPPLLTCRN
ncbi:PREDICTED: uncharacterized protein LOC108560161 [Nicrophorus vespilloides]|uniref:Uncharacterized protein LOC108560161 n=1 Tax=Nicrophorus vespilloides TaxID=110193 RepID=A0ABM1MEU5_NICVS|nr:PREDICTED: uncharacterized protein LOC108560161 [Nicrophorus vespilloides]